MNIPRRCQPWERDGEGAENRYADLSTGKPVEQKQEEERFVRVVEDDGKCYWSHQNHDPSLSAYQRRDWRIPS